MTFLTCVSSVPTKPAICCGLIRVADAQQISALALDLRRGLTRQPLEPVALIGQQLSDEHLRGTHQHLHDRDASQFVTHAPIPVNYSETDH